jgi:predicted enzyme related to lactoylglutathione lyase
MTIQTTTRSAKNNTATVSDGIDRLDFVSLQVRDLEAARAFYADFLGFAVVPAQRADAVIFKTSIGAAFAVRKALVDLDASPKLGGGVGLWFGAKDVDSIHQRAVARGIEILSQPEPGPFGRVFSLRDPDGYAITLHNIGPVENAS